MIVDSSVWVDFLGSRPSSAARAVRAYLATQAKVWLTPTVLQEVLQGARDQSHLDALARTLSAFPMCIPADLRVAARHAATIYARCRWQGVTIRSPNDCLIATVAIEHGQPVLTMDRDFFFIRKLDPRLQLLEIPAET